MIARATLMAFAMIALLLAPLLTAQASSLVGDVNGDCKVNVLDLSLEASRYLIGIGSLLYSPTYDLNHDGVINILDIQMVAAHFNQSC
jgi:hypothetical protein